jgi:5-methylcytosine-specific restriction endonuclease McrA
MLGTYISGLNCNENKVIKCKTSDVINWDVELPDIQRFRNDNKIEEIIKYQLNFYKTHSLWNILGVINIHFCEDNNKYYLIDGQHRYEAIKQLYEKYSHNISLYIELIKVKTYDDLRDNYNLLNKNTKLPDLSENIDKSIPEEAMSKLMNKYSNMISDKSRSNRPHINFNFFQEALGILTEKLNLNKSNELLEIVEKYNTILSTRDRDTFPDSKRISDAMWKKCKDNLFFLGLYKFKQDDYAYKWVKEIYNIHSGKQLKTVKQTKKKIPKKVKTDCWDTWMGKQNRKGICKCCNKQEIDISDFQAGHILSEKNGGTVDIDNLIPLCSQCNLSMSSKNLDEYMAEYYPNNFKNLTKYNDSHNWLGSMLGY